jgi:hypothetical protein
MASPPDFSVGQVLTSAQMNQIGLWLVKTQTVGTAVASVAVADAFTDDFENYKITYNGGVGSTGMNIRMELTGSTTGYRYAATFNNYTGGGVTVFANSAGTRFDYVGESNTNTNHVCIDVLSPKLPKFTTVQGSYIGDTLGGSTVGVHRVATAYTGFTFSVSGTLTGGIIRVYGYNN